jgi:Ca2+-binding EF-hand superfamily protein
MAALNVFIHMMDSKDIDPLRERFQSMDVDRSGFITATEL